MADLTTIRRSFAVLLIALVLSMASVPKVSAQGFISPLIGYNFGGDAGCPEITDCTDKKLNWGVSVGALGNIVGIEAEFAYTKDFFGKTSAQTSNVLTAMANLMLAPKLGPVQPYGVIGLGLVRTSVEATTLSSSSDNSQFGWDGGGGLLVFFGEHFGIRGEVRYYHSFQVLDLSQFPSISTGETKLDFGRAGAGVVFKF